MTPLDELAAALAGRTRKSWHIEETGTHGADIYEGDDPFAEGCGVAHVSSANAHADARAIVALVNSADALLRVARCADAYERASEAVKGLRPRNVRWHEATTAARDAGRDLLAAVRAMRD